MTNQIYVSCLASYNNGVLHGEWIDASADADAMWEGVRRVLRTSKLPNVEVRCHDCAGIGEAPCTASKCATCKGTGEVPSAEEWAIHDFNDEDGIFEGLGEYCGLQAVANRVAIFERAQAELGDDGHKIVFEYWDHVGDLPDDASEAVEDARDAYAGKYESWTAWAEEWLEETGTLEAIPENLRHYFDYEAYGRDARISGDLFSTDGGYFFYNH